jgi:putative transcription factor
MADCDMCGANGKLIKVKVENTIMNLCSNCQKYGTPLGQTKGKSFANNSFFSKKKENIPEVEEYIVSDYGQRIKAKRERLKIKPEEFAKKLNEKESLLLKIENSSLEPNFVLAKKIEQFLKIQLVLTRSNSKIQEEFEKQKEQGESNTNLTFGDILKNALKKNK